MIQCRDNQGSVFLRRGEWVLRLCGSSQQVIEVTKRMIPHFKVDQSVNGTSQFDYSVCLMHDPCSYHPAVDDEIIVNQWGVTISVAMNSVRLLHGTTDAAVRIVREAHRASIWATGDALQLHAGGVAVSSGSAAAIIGSKRSGKTTLLMALLSAGAQYLANDDLMAVEVQGRLFAYGSPRRISLRNGTLEYIPAIPGFSDLLTVSEFDERKDRYLILPHELKRIGFSISPEADLRMLLFPTLGKSDRLQFRLIEDERKKADLLYLNIENPPSRHNISLLKSVPPLNFNVWRETMDSVLKLPAFEVFGDARDTSTLAKILLQMNQISGN